MKKIFLYKITNLVNGKTYCGQTRNIKYRWTKHCKRARSIKRGAMANAIRKYGISKFKVEEIGFVLSRSAADIAERILIEYWRSKGKTYNRAIGGEGGIGWTMGQETRNKMSRSAKQRWNKRSERKKQSIRIRKSFENPVLRKKISKLVCASMTLEVRKKLSDGTKKAMGKMSYARKLRMRKKISNNLHLQWGNGGSRREKSNHM